MHGHEFIRVHQRDAFITPNHQNKNVNDAISRTIDTFEYNIDDSDRDVVPSEHPPVNSVDNNYSCESDCGGHPGIGECPYN
jgi:hypothetical protein